MTRQEVFRAALLDAAQPVPEGLLDDQGRPAGRRFSVYRNNVAVALGEALSTGFPAVKSLIGEQNFTAIAAMHLRQSPPTSPIMAHYGQEFPAFLAALPQLSKWPYLPDVARIELALRDSYHAADAAPLDPARLASMDEPVLLESRFTLSPALRVLPSDWPAVSVYRFALDPSAPKPQPVAEDAIILRPDFDPVVHVLPKGGTAFVEALQRSATLAEAVECAGSDFDLSAMLTLLLSHGGLTDLE